MSEQLNIKQMDDPPGNAEKDPDDATQLRWWDGKEWTKEAAWLAGPANP